MLKMNPSNDALSPFLTKWLETPAARLLLEKEGAYFAQFSTQIFGFHAIQLGFPILDALKDFRIQKKIFSGMPLPNTHPYIICDVHALPFKNESVDLVILPHVLEWAFDSKSVLREIDRILIPEGHLLLTTFHPHSLGGIKRFFGKKNEFPWRGKFLSPNRLKDWLSLLNFESEVENLTPCYSFSLPAVYTLHAVKRRFGMRLIVPNFPSFQKTTQALPAKTFGVLQCPPKLKK